MASQHYALVSQSEKPLDLRDDGRDVNDAASDDDDDAFAASAATAGNAPVREEITGLFQSYAELYPNPRLVEETKQKELLLRAASAATNAKASQRGPTKKKSFFSFLFGGGSDDGGSDNLDGGEGHENGRKVAKNPEDMLQFIDRVDDDAIDDDLCGTTSSLDTSCIPEEAYSVARFHMASTRTRREQPNVVRSSGYGAGTLVVTGLGCIGEFRPDGASQVQYTSDREDLLSYAAHAASAGSGPSMFRVEYARAVVIGQNCIAVSWGLIDGIVVLYRRMAFPDDPRIGWDPIALVEPNSFTLENMAGVGGDLFHDDIETAGSPLLRISDMVPLIVEAPNEVVGVEHPPVVAILAISRLGGYIELVPVPILAWYGPVLTPENHRRRPPSKKRKRPVPHYAMGRLRPLDLATAIAYSTGDYHVDILCLALMRTTVNSSTQWNQQAFPDAPPAESVLAASGVSRQGQNVVTFWSISALFDGRHPDAFRIHIGLLEALPAESGANLSLFVTPEIMRKWRMPRHVELKSDIDAPDNEEADGLGVTPMRSTPFRVTTISMATPIVLMRFSGNTPAACPNAVGPCLALLDWNGSASVLDCTFMEHVASQSLSEEEYGIYRSDQVRVPLAVTVISRSAFANRMRSNATKESHLPVASCLHFLDHLPEVDTQPDLLPPLAVLLKNPRQLLIFTSLLSTDVDKEDLKVSLVRISFPGKGSILEQTDKSGLSFIVRGKKSPLHIQLNHLAMNRLEPRAMIQSLAKASKHREAIQAASKLSEEDQMALADEVQHSYRMLWELENDIESLSNVKDADYVLKSVQKFVCQTKSGPPVTLSDLRDVGRMALKIADKNRNTTSEPIAIGRALVRIGTYELLCRYLKTNSSYATYFDGFADVKLKDLASQLAQTADLMALTILIFRHRTELLPSLLDILNSIPPSVEIFSYSHLIPVFEKGLLSDLFLSPADNEARLHWPQMSGVTYEVENVELVLDPVDEKLVLVNTRDAPSATTLTASMFAKWAVDRAIQSQKFIGNIESVVSFCDICLHSAGVSVSSNDEDMDSMPPDVKKLHKTWKSALSLRRMFAEGVIVVSSNSMTYSQPFAINTEDMLAMNPKDVISLVLGDESDFDGISSKCKDHLIPTLSEMALASTTTSEADIGVAASEYCLSSFDECLDKKDRGDKKYMNGVWRALDVASVFSLASRADIPKSSRLITEIPTLAEMVLSAVQKLTICCYMQKLNEHDRLSMTKRLWDVYESLPKHIPQRIATESRIFLHRKIDFLYQNLVAVDILSSWPGVHPFDLFVMPNQTDDGGDLKFEPRLGEKAVKDIMASFCASLLPTNHQHNLELLRALISDVEQLNGHCFHGKLEVSYLLCSQLTSTLLQQEHFFVVREAEKLLPPSFMDRAQLATSIHRYVNEAVFSDASGGHRISASIQCQKILGPAFPELTDDFSTVRRLLDAAHFMNSILFSGQPQKFTKPSALGKIPALDVLETLLTDSPETILHGCEMWGDEVFAADANRAFRRSSLPTQGTIDKSNDEVPELPCGAVFHLATVLGLESEASVVIVKCRVIHHAVLRGNFGAAASICRTLLDSKKQNHSNETKLQLIVLDATSKIVSNEGYQDFYTKRDLCSKSLVLFSSDLTPRNMQYFNNIVRVSAGLDKKTSAFSNEHFGDLTERGNSNKHPISRLYHHTRAKYSNDIHLLFSDLSSQASEGTVHDSLVDALGKFVMYWNISDSIQKRHVLDRAEMVDANDWLALATSLILHIPNKQTALECIETLQEIAVDQAATVASEETFESAMHCKLPNPSLVKQIMSRGYSENGARHAVMATGSSSANAALQWAVMNGDINEPIIVLNGPSKTFVASDAIYRLQKCLAFVHEMRSASGEQDFPRRLESSKEIATNGARVTHKARLPRQSIAPAVSLGTIPSSSIVHTAQSSKGATAPEIKTPQVRAPPPPGPRPPPPQQMAQAHQMNGTNNARVSNSAPSAESVSHLRSATSNGTTLFGQTLKEHPTVSSNASSNRSEGARGIPRLPVPPPPSRPRVEPINTSFGGVSTGSTGALNSFSPSFSSLSPANPSDREILRKQGRAALDKFRSSVSPLDRDRLLEQGRRLLREAKAQTPTGTKPPPGPPSGPPPGGLSSKVFQSFGKPMSKPVLSTAKPAKLISNNPMKPTKLPVISAPAPKSASLSGSTVQRNSNDGPEDDGSIGSNNSGWDFQDDWD